MRVGSGTLRCMLRPVAVAFLVCALGCASDTGSASGFGSCKVSGAPFGHMGSAVMRGTGTLPTLRNELSLQLLLEAPPGTKVGVLSHNLFEFQKTCGTEFPFEVTGVDAGTYTVWVEVRDPDLADVKDDSDIVYASEADRQVTLADGETVEVDLDFRM